MPRTLKDNVAVDGRWYKRGATAADVGDVAVRIGDHAWVGEDDEPYSRVHGVGAGAGAGEGVDGSAPALDPPAKAGPGSSAEAWRDYARAVGVDVPEDAKRDDIVALVEAKFG